LVPTRRRLCQAEGLHEFEAIPVSAYQLPPYVWPTVMMSVCALTVWRGGDDERLGAGGVLAGWALSMVLFRARSVDTQWGVAVVDLFVLGLFLWMALRSRRYWPLFAAGFQLLAVATHLARALEDGIGGWAYLTAEIVWSYLVILTIGWAAWSIGRGGSASGPPPDHLATAGEPSDVPGATRR